MGAELDQASPGAAKALHRDGGPAAAEAIMTTDTRPKTAQVSRGGWSVGGMAMCLSPAWNSLWRLSLPLMNGVP